MSTSFAFIYCQPRLGPISNLFKHRSSFSQEYIHIFNDHGVELQPDEVERVSAIANDDGEVTKEEFLAYAKSSEFFKSQVWQGQAGNTVLGKVWHTMNKYRFFWFQVK